MSVRIIPVSELHALFKAQGVSAREHVATKCIVCGTVQSIAAFQAIGVNADTAEKQVGFSCIGRHTNAGPFDKKKSKPGLGCDWTLGGLFTIHDLEVETPDGKRHPFFPVASSDEAKALEAALAARDQTP